MDIRGRANQLDASRAAISVGEAADRAIGGLQGQGEGAGIPIKRGDTAQASGGADARDNPRGGAWHAQEGGGIIDRRHIHLHRHGGGGLATGIVEGDHGEGFQGVGARAIGIGGWGPVGAEVGVDAIVAAANPGGGRIGGGADQQGAAGHRLHHKALHTATLVAVVGGSGEVGEGDGDLAVFLAASKGVNRAEGGGGVAGVEQHGAGQGRGQAVAEAQLQAGVAQGGHAVGPRLQLAVDLGRGALELDARGAAVAIGEAREQGHIGGICNREREGLGIAAIGIRIADREEAQAFARAGTDRTGPTAIGVVEHRIAHRQEANAGGSGGCGAAGAIIEAQAQAHRTGGRGLQGDGGIGQQGIDLVHAAGHQPTRAAVDRQGGTAAVATGGQASQAAVADRQGQLGAAAVISQIQIGHADRRAAHQALQAGGHAMAQACHHWGGGDAAEQGWIIDRRHVDRGAAQVLAAASRHQIKAQGVAAIAIAGGREAHQAIGAQVGVEIGDRALQGQLGAIAAADADAGAVAGAEAATGAGPLAHGQGERLQGHPGIGIGQHQIGQVQGRRAVFRGADRTGRSEAGGVVNRADGNGEAGAGRGIGQAAAVIGRDCDLAGRGVGGVGGVGVTHGQQGALEVGQAGGGIGGGLDQQGAGGGIKAGLEGARRGGQGQLVAHLAVADHHLQRLQAVI